MEHRFSLFAFFSKTNFIQFFAFLVFVMTTHMLSISFLAFRRRQLDRRRREDGARRVLKDQALGLPILHQIGKVVEGFQLSLRLKPVDQENTYLLFFS